MSQICCPTCGNALSPSIFAIDDEARIVVSDGKFAVFTEDEFSVFITLFNALGKTKTREQLLKAFCSLIDDAPEIKIIDVHISRIRKKISGMTLTIQNVWGGGYRIIHSGGVT